MSLVLQKYITQKKVYVFNPKSLTKQVLLIKTMFTRDDIVIMGCTLIQIFSNREAKIMKKLLLTTTALAGMTGAAIADVSFSGGANINYKTAEGGNEAVFSSDSNLTATMTNGGAYSAAVGIGVGGGDYGHDLSAVQQEVADWESTEIGVSYVSGDFTLTASFVDAEATDNDTTGATPSGAADSAEKAGVSVDYAVASGVTTTFGMANIESMNEATKDDAASGSAWYLGTNLSW